MRFNKLTKKITAIGTIGLVLATPFAFADEHNTTTISGEIENTQDLEDQLSDINVSAEVEQEIKVEGIELTQDIEDLIDELKVLMEDLDSEVEVEIKAENDEVEVEVEGEITSDIEDTISRLRAEIESLIESSESTDIKIEISLESEVENKDEDSDDDLDEESRYEEDDDSRDEEDDDDSYNLEAEVDVEGVELTQDIKNLIDEIKNSINETDAKIKIKVEADEGQVESETEIRGDLTTQQQDMIRELEDELKALLEGLDDAEVEVEIEGKTSDDRILSNSVGVEMRFTQLQARVDARVENMNMVYDSIEDNLSDAEKEELSLIIEEFTLLQEELNSVDAPDALAFVAYKDEVIKLSTEFKILVQPHINDELRAELKAKIEENKEEKINERKAKIEELRKKLNAKIVVSTFGNVNGLNTSVHVDKYVAGEISLGEFQKELREQFTQLTIEQQSNVNARIEENQNKIAIEAKIEAENRKAAIEEKKEEIRERVESNKELVRNAINNYASLPVEQREKLRQEFENLNESQIEELRKRAEELGIEINSNTRINAALGGE